MLRALMGLAAPVLVAAVAAPAAGAARVYGGRPISGVPDALVLVLPDRGTRIVGVTFHLDVPCGADFESIDAGTTRNAQSVPDRLAAGEHVLVGGRVAGGRLSGSIVGADPVDATTWEHMNVVLAGRVARARASGTMTVTLTHTDGVTGAVRAACRRTIRWRALRDPGVVYAGATSQGEPIVLELGAGRRSVRVAHVSWIGPCLTGQSWVEPHDGLGLLPFPLSGTGRFARTSTFSLGGDSTLIERFNGRVGRTGASGTFEGDVSLAGIEGAQTCATGTVTWTAATG